MELSSCQRSKAVPVRQRTYMKHVVMVRTHFRDTDQLKLGEGQKYSLREVEFVIRTDFQDH